MGCRASVRPCARRACLQGTHRVREGLAERGALWRCPPYVSALSHLFGLSKSPAAPICTLLLSQGSGLRASCSRGGGTAP